MLLQILTPYHNFMILGTSPGPTDKYPKMEHLTVADTVGSIIYNASDTIQYITIQYNKNYLQYNIIQYNTMTLLYTVSTVYITNIFAHKCLAKMNKG